MNVSVATHERLTQMRQAEQRAAELAQRVKDQAAKPLTHNERVRDATANYIAELHNKLRSGLLLPAEREQLKRRIEILKVGHAQVDAEIKEAARVQKFRADHAYQNAREHFAAFAKSPAAPVSAEDIALCGAILDSTEWDDPRACTFAYWREVERVESAARERASKKAADDHHAVLAAEHKAAVSKVAALEREQAVAQARANLEQSRGNE